MPTAHRLLRTAYCLSPSLLCNLRNLGTGVVFVVISFKWLPVIAYWLGDFSRLTPLALLAIFVAELGLSAGLLQVPISLLRLLVSNKQNEEARKQGYQSRHPGNGNLIVG